MASTENSASSSAGAGASTGASTDAPAAAAEGDLPAGADAAPARKQPVEKKPPSLKATLAVLGCLFLFMSPAVRWRISEFNLFVKTCIPYGGNPPYGRAPGGAAADMVTIEALFGQNSELMSGRYLLQKDKYNRRYNWYKNSPGQEAYLLWDDCGAWLISRFPTGNSPNCEGWSHTNRCFGMPWECDKTWMIREDGSWQQAGTTVKVTPFYGEIPKAFTHDCSQEEEQQLIKQFGDFDIVIPWVNGSDPQWLADRESTCEDWQWQEMWSDAIARSRTTQACLKEAASIDEATSLIAKGGCEQGAFKDGYKGGQEGVCAWENLKQAPRGLTTRSSRCFSQFVHAHCAGRANSIKDHDELRYLIRSIERNLPWHRGRILLITPNKTVPSWLKPGSRLSVVSQEDLLRRAVDSLNFVNAADRGRTSEWAPDRIFNDYPVEAALAFVPEADRVLMLVQDDLVFARPTSICTYFHAKPAGLRLFARPYEGMSNKDPYSQVYESTERWTGRLFADRTRKKDGKPSGYYRVLHLPQMLDIRLLEELWREHSEVMSDAVSSSLRHPNLTNTIALHHSEAARRHQASIPHELISAEGFREKWAEIKLQIMVKLGLEVAPDTAKDVDTAHEAIKEGDIEKNENDLEFSHHTINNLVMNVSGEGPIEELPWMEVVFDTGKDWHEKMDKVAPDSSKLPGIIGMQDNFGPDTQEDVEELDCLRETWLNELLPGPSSWEDPAVTPNMCRSFNSSRIKREAEEKENERKACNLKDVVVTGGEAAQPDCMGLFKKTKVKAKDHAGRPVYKNVHGKYLFYRSPTTSWLIGDNHTVISTGVRLQSNQEETTCPTEVKQWEIFDQGWKIGPKISVTTASEKKTNNEGHSEL